MKFKVGDIAFSIKDGAKCEILRVEKNYLYVKFEKPRSASKDGKEIMATEGYIRPRNLRPDNEDWESIWSSN